MGKVGRFACIFTPMALTIGALICLILIWAGGQNKNSSLLRDLYFFRADTSGFTANPDLISGTDIDNKLLGAFKQAVANQKLKDFYNVHIWNYCTGDKSADNKTFTVTYCGPRQAEFWFNPVDVWGLNNTQVSGFFPKKLDDGLKVYEKVSKWMFVAYAIAFFATVAEVIVGIFAIFSRWGSFVTTIVASIAGFFNIAAALTATIMYGALAGTFDTVLRPYKIKASLGGSMLAVVWLAVAFQTGASLFWLFSVCCCSGHSDRPGRRRTVAEKGPYTYERVSSPYLGHNDGVQMGNVGRQSQHGAPAGGAYEPFRHQTHV